MKKLIALALALLLCGCAVAEENWYVDEAQALARQMQALAADEAYCGLKASGNDEVNARREAFTEADLSKPTGAWFLPMPGEEQIISALKLFAAMGGEEDLGSLDGLSDVGLEELAKRLPASAASLLLSRAGVSWIMLSSLVAVGEAKEEPEGFAPGYLLLEYPGDFGVLVTFTRPLPGYVSASASPAPADSLEAIRPLLDSAKTLGLSLELETVEIK